MKTELLIILMGLIQLNVARVLVLRTNLTNLS